MVKRVVYLLMFVLMGCNIVRSSYVSPETAARSIYKLEFSGGFVDESDHARKPVSLTWSGTAWVVDRSRGRSFLLTAAHVCALAGGEYVTTDHGVRRGFDVSYVDYSLLGSDGVRVTGVTAVARDEKSDLCLLAVMGDLGDPLPISDSDPPYGSEGYYIGAPHGIFGNGVAGYFSMHFSGRGHFWGSDRPVALAFSSALGAPGGSGSPIIFRGRVVALFNFVVVNFPTIATGVPHDLIREFVRNYLEGWPHVSG